MTDNTKDDKSIPVAGKASTRRMPTFGTGGIGEAKVKIGDDTVVPLLYGTRTNEAATGILLSAISALGNAGELYRPFIVALAAEMEPQDALEAMLVTQMAATHVAMTGMSQKMIDATSPNLRETYERSMTRLSRTYLAQMDALKKYRAKAQQVVRVERVTVHEGGQAIVGPVTHGGPGWR